MKETLQLKDFLDFKYIGQPKYNDNGDTLAFVVANAIEDDNAYESFLYVYKNDTIKKLTSTGKESFFYWKDNETIIFRNTRDKKDQEKIEAGEELSVYYSININGGEAVRAFGIPLQVGSIKPINNHLLLNVNFNEQYSIVYDMNEEDKKELLAKKKEMEDYHVLTQVPFYFNGQGYIDGNRSALFLYDEKSEALERITDQYIDVSSSEYDAENNLIYYTATLFKTVQPLKEKLFVYDVASKQTKQLLDDELSIHDFKLRQDDILIAGAKTEDYGINENPQFYTLKNGTLKLALEHDASIGSSVGSDSRFVGGAQTKMHDGNYYFISTIDDGSQLQCLNENNELSTVVKLKGSVDCFDIANDTIALVAMNDGQLQELYTYRGTLEQVSTMNKNVLENKYIADYEPLTFTRDGYELHGWVLKPKDYDPKQFYPAILDIHGGPKTVYGPVFYHEMQVWANKGAFVFFMNPRGSDGRGNEFADIRGKYGTGDYDDLMMFTDLVLETYPAIDKKRVAVTGGSYGGFMTNWIIGHTDRFISAASQRSISNWIGFTYSSDIGPYFAVDQQGANLYDDVEKLWWHSPLKYARNVKTPTLFIHSDEDFRCPYFEGIQMYGALMEQDVETRLVMFKGENHELSRGGKPKHRIKRLEEITDWIFKYF